MTITTFWNQHGTKVLGATTSIVSGFLAIPDFITQPHVKYVAAVNVVLGVITANRGWVNSKNLAATKT